MANLSSRLTVVDSLDGFHTWPVKYRHWMFEVVESDEHELWVGTHELRLFMPELAKDKHLVPVWNRSMLYATDIKAYFVTIRAMKLLLRRAKGEPGQTEVLKFLDWMERNVVQAAANKRRNKGLDALNSKREAHEAKVIVGPIPAGIAPVRLEATTLPMTDREQWAKVQPEPEIPRVFHIEALRPRVTLGQWLTDQLAQLPSRFMKLWRGQLTMPATFLISLAVMGIPGCVGSVLSPASLDWTQSYVRVYWSAAVVAALSFMAGLWFFVTMSRCLWLRFSEKRLRNGAIALYCVMLPVAPIIALEGMQRELLENWRDLVTGRYRPAQVYADPHLGRIVIRGEMKFGSTEALVAVLDRNPRLSLVQIESPGGYVIEGLRMARLIQERKMDTVSMESCDSACTLVLAAGQDRYLGPEVQVGFHRSGRKYGPVSLGWSSVDHRIAEYYLSRGVKEDFVVRALQPAIHDLWVPSHGTMYAAGYASLRWIERKAGY